MLYKRRWTIVAMFALGCWCTGQVSAQASEKTEYKEKIEEALVEYDAGRWDEALTLFKQAHAINPNARTLRGMGKAAFESSDYVTAMRYLKQALDDDRKPLTKRQRKEVREIISKANGFVGRFRVRLTPFEARVTVGGYPVHLENGEMLLNPGDHDLMVRAEGYDEQRLSLSVRGARTGEIEITLQPSPVDESQEALEPPPQQPITDETASVDDEETSSSLVLYILMGAGGVLLVGSAVTGVLSFSAKQELVDECDPDHSCSEDLQSTKERGEALQISSFILLGTGVAAAATGFILLLLADSEQESSAANGVSFGCDAMGCQGSIRTVF